MIAVAVAFDMLTPPQYFASPMLVAACLVAGALLGLGGTLSVLVAAVCACVVVAVLQHRWGQTAGTAEIVDVAVAGLVAVGVNRLVTHQRGRLAASRNVAEEMQRVLLPVPARRLADLEVAARYRAAHSEAKVGGDLYAVRRTPFGVRMMVGDVRGKGLGAVAVVSVLMGAFREGAAKAGDLSTLAAWLEDALEREAESADVFERRFVTVVLAEVPPTGSRLRLLNRGHPPPYLVVDGRVTMLTPTEPDVPLGLRDLTPGCSAPTEVVFPTGAVLLMVSDGITEARNAAGVFYDPRPCLSTLDMPYRAPRVVDSVAAEVDRWARGHAQDDQAILAVVRTEGGHAVTSQPVRG